MVVYIVEGGEYADGMILAVCSTKRKAIYQKKKWDKKNSYPGDVIPKESGGDGIKRWIINEATITAYEVK